jgi:hypothetical protein
MEPIDTKTDLPVQWLNWIAQADTLLADAGLLIGAARADEVALSDRLGLCVEIAAVRKRLGEERAALIAEERRGNC